MIVLEVTQNPESKLCLREDCRLPKQKLLMLFWQWRNETALIITDSERRKLGCLRKRLRFSTCQRKVNRHHSQTPSSSPCRLGGMEVMTPLCAAWPLPLATVWGVLTLVQSHPCFIFLILLQTCCEILSWFYRCVNWGFRTVRHFD